MKQGNVGRFEIKRQLVGKQMSLVSICTTLKLHINCFFLLFFPETNYSLT